MNQDNKLMFVYNANSSLFNQVGDLIHKTILPKTYQCNLCGLTYSGVRMRSDWKDFINSLPIKAEFLHKDEFFKKFPKMYYVTFPTVLLKQGGNLLELISTQEINQVKDLEELKKLISTKVSNIKYGSSKV